MEMNTIGFPISHKENEKRRAILPEDVKKSKFPHQFYFEKGYAEVLGITDSEYEMSGANVVKREVVLAQNIICDPKIGDGDYLANLKPGTIIFGWMHATQNRSITDKCIESKLTAYAWEKMYYKGRHIFWKNNELAGEAAILNAFQCYGELPWKLDVAVIGTGNTSRGAIKALNMLGANVTQYDRRTESLLREEISNYDVIVNCVLWDIFRKDHIIYKSDLKKMKKNAFIIDVSCDRHGGIETSIPTTIDNPIYIVDGIVHYVVDHTPAIFFKTFTIENSKVILPYLDMLISTKHNDVLQNCQIIKNGIIVDQEINKFQKRKVDII